MNQESFISNICNEKYRQESFDKIQIQPINSAPDVLMLFGVNDT